MFLNVGCNKQVFSRPWKKLVQIRGLVVSEKKRKNRLTPTHSNSKNDIIKPKAKLF